MQFKVRGANAALTIVTLTFAANFSVWTLYAALGLDLKGSLNLSLTQLGLLFSSPLFSGALSSIVAGGLADRINPKNLLIYQMLITAPALFLLPFVETFMSYILFGLWLGLSGASFIIGLRYAIAWFDRHSQGTTMGIFGVGDVGVGVTLLFVPYLISTLGWKSVGPIYGALLLAIAFLFWLFAPKMPETSPLPRAGLSWMKVATNLQIWRFGLYYYFVFGSFVALVLWLPQYYVSAYGLSLSNAIALTVAFVVASSIVRALGGWFSDRYGGRSVNWAVFWICIICLFFLSYPPTTMTIHGVEKDVKISIELNVWIFSMLLLVIGLAQGFGRASVFKIIHEYYPKQMGQVGGFVAGIGMIGGCTLPVIFGFSVDLLGIHSACFMALYGVLAVCMTVMFLANKSARHQERIVEAKQYNFLDYD